MKPTKHVSRKPNLVSKGAIFSSASHANKHPKRKEEADPSYKAARIQIPRPHTEPIYQTSVYDYPDLETLDDYYNGLIPDGYIYSRNGLPNSSRLARDVAKLEGAPAGLVCSSGMAALLVALLSNLRSGDDIVASSDLYGGTTVLLSEELSRFGIKTIFEDASNGKEFGKALTKGRTKLALVETITNPTMKLADLREISEAAHHAGAMLVVDNTFATPFVAQPWKLGAEVVMHSGTKSLGGHDDLTIGVLCGSEEVISRASKFSTRAGTIAGPFDCWLGDRSIATWKVRTHHACANALRLARYLEGKRDKVERVYYPGLKSHPQHILASGLFEKGLYGSMLSFDLIGGLESASAFVKGLHSVTLTPSLGGVHTTISHPGKTSHRHISAEQKMQSGISDSMIRVSVGIEDYAQIEEDFAQALEKK